MPPLPDRFLRSVRFDLVFKSEKLPERISKGVTMGDFGVPVGAAFEKCAFFGFQAAELPSEDININIADGARTFCNQPQKFRAIVELR
jgi:hypothetical protein